MSIEADYQPIPVHEAQRLAESYAKSMVVILAHDPVHEMMHTTTYGADAVEKEIAAEAGKICTAALGGDLNRLHSFEDFHDQYAPALLAECLELLRRSVARQGMTTPDVAQAERILKSISRSPRQG